MTDTSSQDGILPVKQSLIQTRQYYDRLSRWYDWLSGSTERKYSWRGLHLLDLQPGERVLEIGFGTGHALLAAGQAVAPGGEVVGVDLSSGMIRQARLRLDRQPVESKVSLLCGDAVHLPLASEWFNAVFVSFTLELFDTPLIPAVLAECQRILLENGRLSVVALSRAGRPRLGVSLYEWIHRTFPGALDCRPIPALTFIERAGFKIIEVDQPVMLGFLPLEIVLGSKSPSPDVHPL